MDITEIVLKLLLAVALGGLIGMERESSHKPAGFRTNILICIGSTMVMILSGLLLEGLEGGGDYTRIAAAVIILTLIIFRVFEDRFLTKRLYHYRLKTAAPMQVIMDVKKFAIYEGIKFKEIKYKKEDAEALISLAFPSTEENEQKFHQEFINHKEITEITVD